LYITDYYGELQKKAIQGQETNGLRAFCWLEYR